jgi:hypothetical protein
MNETGEIVGMVDVLKLTYATLEQVRNIPSSGNVQEQEILTLVTGEYNVYERERRPGVEQVLAFYG